MFRDNKNAYQRLAEIFGINSNAPQGNGASARPKLWDENTDYEGSDPEVKHILSQILNTDYDTDVAMNVAPAWLTKLRGNVPTPGIANTANPASLPTPALSPSPSPAPETLLRPAGWRAPNFRKLGKALMEGWKSPEMIAHEKLQSESPESSPNQFQAAPLNQAPLTSPYTSDWKFGDVSPFRRLVQKLQKEFNDSEQCAIDYQDNTKSRYATPDSSHTHLPALASDINTATDVGEPLFSGSSDNASPANGGFPGFSRDTIIPKASASQESKKQSSPNANSSPNTSNVKNSSPGHPTHPSSANAKGRQNKSGGNTEAQPQQTPDQKKQCAANDALTYDEFLRSLSDKQREGVTEGGEFHYNVFF